MNLKNICVAMAMMTSMSILPGCSDLPITELREYQSFAQSPSQTKLTELILEVKDKYETDSEIKAIKFIWDDLIQIPNTIQKETILKQYYDSTKIIIPAMSLNATELNIWLHIEDEAILRGIIPHPETTTDTINRAINTTNADVVNLAYNTENSRTSYMIGRLQAIQSNFEQACQISKKSINASEEINKLKNNMKLLSTKPHIQYMNRCVRYCSALETDKDLYTRQILEPIANASCDL